MRTQFTLTVQNTTGDAQSGASVAVTKRSDASAATVYAGETGPSQLSNPLASDARGVVQGWLDRGAYLLTPTKAGLSLVNPAYDSAPASDGAIDGAWIATGTIGAAQIADGSITLTEMTSGAAASGSVPTANGSGGVAWLPGSGAPTVTALPTTGLTADKEVVLDLGGGVKWRCRYDATRSKWAATGPPLYAKVDTSEPYPGATYADTTTVGPSITLPAGVGGDFLIAHGFKQSTGANETGVSASVRLGAVAAVDADSIGSNTGYSQTNPLNSVGRETKVTGIAQGAVIKQQYGLGFNQYGGGGVRLRFLSITPVELY